MKNNHSLWRYVRYRMKNNNNLGTSGAVKPSNMQDELHKNIHSRS